MKKNVLKALRLLFISPREFLQVGEIKRSGLFDRSFYISANPWMHPLSRMFPERHYLTRGEKAGLYPFPAFSPHAYLAYNDDVAQVGISPLVHYIRTGRQENRLTSKMAEIEPGTPLRTPILRNRSPATAPHAIVVHLYYHDLWPEFAAVLRRLDVRFDLFVTITVRAKDEDQVEATALAVMIETDFPGAQVFQMRNHGRDIYPFLHLVNAGWLDDYEAVCKIHTKKSPHRDDGDQWRDKLIGGILPGDGSVAALLRAFKADDHAGFWVADGQNYSGVHWWGTNFDRVTKILHRVEVPTRRSEISFPAGSMYWLKPVIVEMIKGLQLVEDQFETEMGQTDGTLAHAVERALGHLAKSGGLATRETAELQKQIGAPAGTRSKPAYVSAFYLPQFHPVPQNDQWWGKGFTEWTGVSRARPQYDGHMQPYLPADLGFYDLRLTEVMGEQTALARAAGVDAFCVYHYWFDGTRILETPVDRLLTRPDIDFPFYLCWANECWRRNWDGLSGEVLLAQSYAPGWEAEFAASLLPYFADPRYQRPDGTRPRFVIYRPEDMPDPDAAVAALRATWRGLGVGEVELGAVRFHVPGANPVADSLFDFWIEMPPHGLVQEADILFADLKSNLMGPAMSLGFAGLIYDYAAVAARSCDPAYLATLPPNTIAGIMPSWDNTARRGSRAHIAWGANPASFEHWLRNLLVSRLPHSYRQELFVNSWNEWGEKAGLEPSAQYGQALINVMARRFGLQKARALGQETR